MAQQASGVIEVDPGDVLEVDASEVTSADTVPSKAEGYFQNAKGERLLQSQITKDSDNARRLTSEKGWTWHPPEGASSEHGGAVGSAVVGGVPGIGSITAEDTLTGALVARGVTRAVAKAAPGVISRLTAASGAAATDPRVRFEIIRGGLQSLGVPYPIAMGVGMVFSGRQGSSAAKPSAPVPGPATVPPATGPAAASRTGFAAPVPSNAVTPPVIAAPAPAPVAVPPEARVSGTGFRAPVPGNAVTPAVIAAPAPAPVAAVPPEARVSGTGFAGPASLAETAAFNTRFAAPTTGTASPWSMPPPAAPQPVPLPAGPPPRLVPQGTALPSTPASVPPLQSTIQQAVEQARAAPPLMSPASAPAAVAPAAVAPAAAVPVPAGPASGPAATWSPKLLQEAVEKAASRVKAQLTEAQITQASQLIREGHPPVSAVQRVLTMTDVQRLSAQVGSEKAAKILGTTKENVKELRGASISALPEKPRAAIDAQIEILTNPLKFTSEVARRKAIQDYLAAAPKGPATEYVQRKLGSVLEGINKYLAHVGL